MFGRAAPMIGVHDRRHVVDFARDTAAHGSVADDHHSRQRLPLGARDKELSPLTVPSM